MRGRGGASRKRFTEVEDARLEALIESIGTGHWAKVASKMAGRNARQVRDRWTQYLERPDENRPWTDEEDVLLVSKVDELGTRWCAIAPCFDARTHTGVRARWLVLERRANKAMSSADSSRESDRDVDEKDLPEGEKVESVADVQESETKDLAEWKGFPEYVEFWALWENRGFLLSGGEDD
jgi:hypothetical protein